MTNEKAIEILTPFKNYTFGDKLHGGSVSMREIIEMLSRTERRWIPVAEALPEKEGEYDVTIVTENSNKEKRYETGFDKWSKKGLGFEWSYHSNELIVAWRPRPKPYKPDNK